MEVLKVSSKSSPNACAGALAGVLRQAGACELQVVGAGALNQAVKAIAIARGFVAASGIDLVCVPTFADIEIDGENRTAIRMLVEDRHHRRPVALDVRDGREARFTPLGDTRAADGAVPRGDPAHRDGSAGSLARPACPEEATSPPRAAGGDGSTAPVGDQVRPTPI